MKKLSEFSTEEGMNVLCELSPFVYNISTDDELMKELRRAISPPKTTTTAEWTALGISKASKLIPIILKKRRDDVLGILAVLNEKPIAEIKKQSFLVSAKQIKEIINDKDLLDFFASCTDSGESE